MAKAIEQLERTAGMPGGILRVLEEFEVRLSAIETQAQSEGIERGIVADALNSLAARVNELEARMVPKAPIPGPPAPGKTSGG